MADINRRSDHLPLTIDQSNYLELVSAECSCLFGSRLQHGLHKLFRKQHYSSQCHHWPVSLTPQNFYLLIQHKVYLRSGYCLLWTLCLSWNYLLSRLLRFGRNCLIGGTPPTYQHQFVPLSPITIILRQHMMGGTKFQKPLC